LARAINELLDPIREKRSYYEKRIDDVREILHQGTARARAIAGENMEDIICHMGLFRP